MQTTTKEELKAKIDRGDQFYLVEALPHMAWEHQHLPGALNLPPGQVGNQALSLLPDRSAEIVVYCANLECGASEEVAKELEAMGYADVKDYQGGKQDWIDAGYPTESLHHHAQQ